jgi:opacity protein-like surface antigen
MKTMMMVTAVCLMTATAARAQTRNGYVEANGGFATTTDATAGAVSGEVGYEVMKNLFVVGSFGDLRNVDPSTVQATVDASVAALNATGLSVLGDPRVSARYALGGARYEIPRWTRATPYVSAGLGFARLTPSARFTYQSGNTIGGTTALAGEDATSDVVTGGFFTAPASSSALMVRVGAGVKIPIANRVVGDIGYSVSRISSDTPISAQGLQFGIGYRF